MKRRLVVTVVVALCASACSRERSKPADPIQPAPVALPEGVPAALIRFAAAAEAARYGGLDAGASEAEVIAFAKQSDPPLIQRFDGYQLRARFVDRHAGVMLCTKDGGRALLEDVGCTGELERNFTENNQVVPCAFTLDVTKVCAVPTPQQQQ